MARPGRRQRSKRGDKGAVPVDAFSDIAFLIIIFFMVVTTLTKARGFETELPSARESQSQESKEVPTIALEGEQILYNTDAVAMRELRGRLADLELADKEDQSLRIIKLKSGPNVSYDLYYQVWAAIANAGGVVTLVKEKDS